MNTTLATYIFGHNLQAILYPFIPSIESALELTRYVNGPAVGGKVWFAVCDCDDDTERIIREKFALEISRGELMVVYHHWGTHHTIQAHICNFLLDEIGERTTYALKLDADEVVHEVSFENFKADLINMAHGNHILGRPHYTHFSPNFWTTWPFIYDSKAVLSRTSFKLRFSTQVRGDACALGGAPELQTRLEIFHYGKVNTGRGHESLIKERTFQKLYSHPEDGIGFPDPKVEMQAESGVLDYTKVFDVDLNAGRFHPFLGTHPKFVEEWIGDMEAREELARNQ